MRQYVTGAPDSVRLPEQILFKLIGESRVGALHVVAQDGTAVIASAEVLFQGTFERVDQHLMITGPGGERFLVRGYFAAAETPLLASPDGAVMLPDTVRALAGDMLGDMLAQAGPAAGAGAIGRVDVLNGTASVQRGGNTLRLQLGDPVFKGDVVSTQGAGSTLGVKFIDGTVFSLSANARMVLNDLVYNPGGSNNSMTANLIQGTFVFVAGQTAQNGDMKIGTPVATMGIRGTTPLVTINAANGQTTFSILPDPDSNRIGSYDLLEVLTGRLIRSVSETGRALLLTAVGATPLDRPYTTGELATNQSLQAQITDLYRTSLQSPTIDPLQQPPPLGDRTEAVPLNPLAGNVDVALTDPDRQAIDLAALDKTPKAPTAVQYTGLETDVPDKPSDYVAVGFLEPDPIVLDAIGGPITLSPLNGGSVTENSQIVFFDLAQGQSGLTISQVTLTASNGRSVTAFLIGTQLAIDPAQFKYLNNNQSVTLSLSYSATNGTASASTSGQLVITGMNDSPTARTDYFSGTAPGDAAGSNVTGNVLTNDTDIDSLGPFTIVSVNGIVPHSPIVVPGVRGTLTLDSTTGGFTFVPNSGPENRALGALATGTEDFYYIVTDPEGGQTTGVLTIALQGQNDTPIGVDDFAAATAGGQGPAMNASGNLLANDTEYDVGDIVLVTSVEGTPMPPGGTTPITVTPLYGYGQATFYPNGAYVYTPSSGLNWLAAGQSVTDSFYYTAADGWGGSTSATLMVTLYGQNDAPTAVNDSGTAQESGTGGPGYNASGNVLSNDSDIDSGDTLHVSALNYWTFANTYSATNAYGTFTVDSTGAWTFAVDNLSATVQALGQGQSATFSHTITVTDSFGASSNSLIDITVLGQNDAPTAVADVDSATEDTLKTVLRTLMFANDIDPDTGDTKNLYSLTAIWGGSIAFSGGGANFNPDANFSGQGQFGYTMRDAAGFTSYATVTVDIAPVADAPTIVLDGLLPTPTALGSEFRINSTTTGQQESASVANLKNGGFVATWASDGQDGSGHGIYARIFDGTGTPVSGDLLINTYTTDSQTHPAVNVLNNGTFVVTWISTNQDGSGTGIYGQLMSTSGTPVGGEFLVNQTTANYQYYSASTTLSDGSFVITWQSDGQDGSGVGVYGRRYDASGTPLTSEFQINTYVANDQAQVSVAALAGGGFVVTWESAGQDGSGNGVYARIFDAAGDPVGIEFGLNTFTAGDQERVAVAGLNDGSFVATWNSTLQDGDGRGIIARRFDAAGAPLDAEFLVNTYTTSDQQISSVIGLLDGGFLISWRSTGQDGDAGGIYAQRYGADGIAIGGEFMMNQTTAGTQQTEAVGNSIIAQLNDGSVVATWYGAPSVDFHEIYARQFAVPGAGTEDSTVNLGTMQFTTPDTDGSETIVVVLTGQPAGATFNKGYVDPGNSSRWIIDGGDVNALSTNPLVMTPPANWNGTFTLTVTANVTDSAVLTTGTVTDTETGSATMSVVVASVNDAPVANGETVIGYNTATGTSIHIPYSAILFNDTDVDNDTLSLHSASSTWGAVTLFNGGVDFTQSPLITGPETVDYDVSDTHGALSGQATMTFYDSADLSSMSGTSGDDILISEYAVTEMMGGGAGRDVFVYQMDTMNGAVVTDYQEGEDAIWVPVAASAIGSGSLDDFVRVFNGNVEVDLDGLTGGANWQWIGTIGVTTGTNDDITVLLDDSSSATFRGDIIAQFL